uniref:RING-type domain-containing protein n=1 Tax=Ananas comosus var. bracteatus TaxID=296719 RepID=A0A6V7QG82_ANACO|nr:unnamed protein product [Ananas comosus var. bracteatus]
MPELYAYKVLADDNAAARFEEPAIPSWSSSSFGINLRVRNIVKVVDEHGVASTIVAITVFSARPMISRLWSTPPEPASAWTLKALERCRLIPSGASEEEETCPICLAEIPAQSPITRMPCSHFFHEECIVRVFGRDLRRATELFQRAKAVRLKSHHDKYLFTDDDELRVTQDRDGASPNTRWAVEHVPVLSGDGAGGVTWLCG